MSQILYRGAPIGGAYSGGNIQALIAEATGNAKTGPALTLWILPDTADGGPNPWALIKAHGSASTCGDCPLQDGRCYTHAGASQVLTTGAASIVKARSCDDVKPSKRVRRARSAAFGDAAALPLHVLERWRAIRAQYDLAPLGYTHAWRTRPDLAVDHMASVETVDDAAAARAAGWRYFRVRPVGSPLLAGEIQCPASAESTRANAIDCNRCGLCDGIARGNRRPSVSIEDHGAGAKVAKRAANSLRIGA